MHRPDYPHGWLPEQRVRLTGRFIHWVSTRKFYQVVLPALLGAAIPAAFSVPAAADVNQPILMYVVLVVADLPIAAWLVCRYLARPFARRR